jgi:DNA-binding transcriptional MerR regulator
MTIEFGQSEVSQITGISSVTLRDWRRRNLLDGIGTTNAAGRWCYRRGEIVTLASAKQIETLGIDLSRSIEIAVASRGIISERLRPPDKRLFEQHKFIASWPVESGQTRVGAPVGKLEAVQFNDLNRIVEYAGIGAIVIDIEKITQAMPKKIQDLFREAE